MSKSNKNAKNIIGPDTPSLCEKLAGSTEKTETTSTKMILINDITNVLPEIILLQQPNTNS